MSAAPPHPPPDVCQTCQFSTPLLARCQISDGCTRCADTQRRQAGFRLAQYVTIYRSQRILRAAMRSEATAVKMVCGRVPICGAAYEDEMFKLRKELAARVRTTDAGNGAATISNKPAAIALAVRVNERLVLPSPPPPPRPMPPGPLAPSGAGAGSAAAGAGAGGCGGAAGGSGAGGGGGVDSAGGTGAGAGGCGGTAAASAVCARGSSALARRGIAKLDIERVGSDVFSLAVRTTIGTMSDRKAYLVSWSVAGHSSRLSIMALLVAIGKPPQGTGAARVLLLRGLHGLPKPRRLRFWIPDQGELKDVADAHCDCLYCLADSATIRDPRHNDLSKLTIQRTIEDFPQLKAVLVALGNDDVTDLTFILPAYRHWLAIIFTALVKSRWDADGDDLPTFIRGLPNAHNVNFGDPGRYGDVHEQRTGLSLNTLAAATDHQNRAQFLSLWSDQQRPVPWRPDADRVSWRRATAALCRLRWSSRSAGAIESDAQIIADSLLVLDPAALTRGVHIGFHYPGIMRKHAIVDINDLVEENIEMANQIFDDECDWLRGDGVRALKTSFLPLQLADEGHIDPEVRLVGAPPHPTVFLHPVRPRVGDAAASTAGIAAAAPASAAAVPASAAAAPASAAAAPASAAAAAASAAAAAAEYEDAD